MLPYGASFKEEFFDAKDTWIGGGDRGFDGIFGGHIWTVGGARR
jgi:hypothetical protein